MIVENSAGHQVDSKFYDNWHHRMKFRWSMTTRGPGIGKFNPGRVILLVGDKPAKRHANFPFCSHLQAGCSWWLANVLDSHDIKEEQLYWVNAYGCDGYPRLAPDFVSDLSPHIVVALGKTASYWCDGASIEHISVHHPQYWKRFKFGQTYPLLDLLWAVQNGGRS